MYSRCAEWTAAALLYRHNTMTEDSTSSVASNYRVKSKNKQKKKLHSLHCSVQCSDSRRSFTEVETYSKSKSWSTVPHDGNSWKENREEENKTGLCINRRNIFVTEFGYFCCLFITHPHKEKNDYSWLPLAGSHLLCVSKRAVLQLYIHLKSPLTPIYGQKDGFFHWFYMIVMGFCLIWVWIVPKNILQCPPVLLPLGVYSLFFILLHYIYFMSKFPFVMLHALSVEHEFSLHNHML